VEHGEPDAEFTALINVNDPRARELLVEILRRSTASRRERSHPTPVHL
jgi:hypothetical protein